MQTLEVPSDIRYLTDIINDVLPRVNTNVRKQ